MADYLEALHMLPGHMQDGMKRYIARGEYVGDFLFAVLSNDLKGAFGRADSTNITHIGDYVSYLYNFAPSECWGSPEKVVAWQRRGGLEGKTHED